MNTREIEIAKLRRTHIEEHNQSLRKINSHSRVAIQKATEDHHKLVFNARLSIEINEQEIGKNQDEYNKLGEQLSKHHSAKALGQ